MKLKNIKIYNLTIAVLILSLLFSSCKKYVDIGKAPDQLLIKDAYKEDATATSAVLTLYGNDNTVNSLGYFSWLGGIESDEMVYAFSSDPTITEFQNTTVTPSNTTLLYNLWQTPYSVIGTANIAIDGLNNSTTLTPSVKNQLLGECKFFRAFFYFNLVNYFGGVPLSLSADAMQNAHLPRASVDSVWKQIIADLKDAENLLPSQYVGPMRARANKYAASALLARAYLYTKDYTDAETEASKVISASDISYTLPALDQVFLNTSNGVILQLAPTGSWSNYPILGTYYLSYGEFTLAPGFASSFETGDNRATVWTDGTNITKYALGGNESNVLLRLAEQYLIRAEARAQLNNFSGAANDLNMVRNRAGLGNTSASTQPTLLNAVANERKAEFFGEFAHRWFDLKRTGQVDAVLTPLKTAWKSTAALEPIPSTEITKNQALVQNPGYPK